MTHLKNVLLQKLIRTNKINLNDDSPTEAIASIVNLNALNVKSNDTFMKLSGKTYIKACLGCLLGMTTPRALPIETVQILHTVGNCKHYFIIL